MHSAGTAQHIATISPEDSAGRLQLQPGKNLVLVDDCEAFVDTAAGDALTSIGANNPDVAMVVSGRTEDLLVAYRGMGAMVRRSRCCVLLQPSPADGELVGQRLANTRSSRAPGRGVLIPDPAWVCFPALETLGDGPLPIQVAVA